MVEGAGANKESGAVSRTEAAAAAELRTSQSRRVRDFHPIGYVRSGRTKKEADLSRPLFRYVKKLFLAGNNFLGGLHDMRSVKSVCLEKFCRST